MSARAMLLLLSGLLLPGLSAGGCKRPPAIGSQPSDAGGPRRERPAPRREDADRAGKIKVSDGADATLFVLDPSEKGYHVEAGDGRKIGSVKVEEDRVKVADASGVPACKVKEKDEGLKLYREPARPGGADVELARLKGDGGDFRIQDAQDRDLYRARLAGGKVRVARADGGKLVVKEKADGVEVEDAAGKRLIRMKGLKSAQAAVFCASPDYDTLQKAAVTAFIARVGR